MELGIFLALAIFNGMEWEPLAPPIEMPSMEQCAYKVQQFLEDTKDIAKDAPVSAACNMGMIKRGDPA